MRDINRAIDKLSEDFDRRQWAYLDVPGMENEKKFAWPGAENEDIIICVHKGKDIEERFHRQDFFFLNFAYRGNYGAISHKYDNHITVNEGECYIGQPFSGYVLFAHSDTDIVIVGILIRKEAFYRTFLSLLSHDSRLFRFFLEPQTKEYSDDFIRLHFEDDGAVRSLLEMMICEYSEKGDDTQDILRPLTMSLLMFIARQNRNSPQRAEPARLSEKIIGYMNEHTAVGSLKEIARHFGYHPNYISAVLRKETGRSFSEILLGLRMERAAMLLKNTSLSVEEIATMLGFVGTSNFYRAFSRFYGVLPKEFRKENAEK